MYLNVYSMYDLNAEYYMQPFFLRSDNEALRAFQVATEDDQSFISKFPNQFDLYKIGKFDDSTGCIEYEHTWLANGNNFARKEEDA